MTSWNRAEGMRISMVTRVLPESSTFMSIPETQPASLSASARSFSAASEALSTLMDSSAR